MSGSIHPHPSAVSRSSGWRGKTPQKMGIKQQSGCGFDIHWDFKEKGLKNPLWMNLWRGLDRPSCLSPGAVFSLLDPLGKKFTKPKWDRRRCLFFFSEGKKGGFIFQRVVWERTVRNAGIWGKVPLFAAVSLERIPLFPPGSEAS